MKVSTVAVVSLVFVVVVAGAVNSTVAQDEKTNDKKPTQEPEKRKNRNLSLTRIYRSLKCPKSGLGKRTRDGGMTFGSI